LESVKKRKIIESMKIDLFIKKEQKKRSFDCWKTKKSKVIALPHVLAVQIYAHTLVETSDYTGGFKES
jgi:hypothetical protein